MPSPSPAPRVPERSSPSLVRSWCGEKVAQSGPPAPRHRRARPRRARRRWALGPGTPGGSALATRGGEWERSCARGKPGLSCGEGLAAGRGPGRPAKPAPGTCTLRNTRCLSPARSDPGLRGRHRRGGPLQLVALLHVQGPEGVPHRSSQSSHDPGLCRALEAPQGCLTGPSTQRH